MLTFSNLASRNWGNLGNQLFQVASIIGLSETHNTESGFPDWKYSQYFEHALPKQRPYTQSVSEPSFAYCPGIVDGFDLGNGIIDVKGWLQSFNYFKNSIDKVLKQFTFKKSFADSLRNKFSSALSKPTIAISIRRGDYVNNRNYVLLPINYYISALFENFPDWRNCNIIIFSDDIPYCKVHFGCLANVFFAEGSDIEQLCLGSMCNHFIIANSTFSYWLAMLGYKAGSKVIRSPYYFSGDLVKTCNVKTFYPAYWTNFDHYDSEGKIKKIDLQDCMFTIPVYYDHPDRKENLDLCLAMLNKSFDTNIIVMEHDGNSFAYLNEIENLFYIPKPKWEMEHFHRTKMLNEMAKASNLPIILNWDADIIIPTLQIFEAVEKIRSGQADMVYPYDGRFARVERSKWLPVMHHYFDAGMFKNTHFKGMSESDYPSVGGAIVVNRDKFFESGAENEKFISYSCEDIERKMRWDRLGYKVQRIRGVLYHIDHNIGVNSSSKNPHFIKGEIEYAKEAKMSKQQLKEYVATWPSLTRDIPTAPVTVTVVSPDRNGMI